MYRGAMPGHVLLIVTGRVDQRGSSHEHGYDNLREPGPHL